MIRKFQDKDINNIMEIWKNENIKAHNFIKSVYWINNYNYVKKLLPKTEIYIYEEQEKIIGFIGLDNNYIEGIFIDSSKQHKGIGTALLNKVKENRNNLTLNVYEKNVGAIDFYLKNGFTVTNRGIDKETVELEYTMAWNK